MNSPILAIPVMIVILTGSALTFLNRACKSDHHWWCAAMSELVQHPAKGRRPA